MCKHVTVVLPNRPGMFSEVTNLLSDHRINILGFMLKSEGRQGLLNLLCNDHQKAFQCLTERYKFYCSEDEILVVEVKHEPGNLKVLIQIIADENINLPVAYQGFSEKGKALIALQFDNRHFHEKARDILKSKGFKVLNRNPV